MSKLNKIDRVSPKSGLFAKFVNPIIDAINKNTEKTNELLPDPDNIISYIYLDQTGKTLDPSRMITGDIGCKGTAKNNAIAWIRDNSHAYGGRIETHNGKSVMALKQLSDTTRQIYINGETSIDNSEYGAINEEDSDINVFMKLPTFWFKIELIKPDVYKIGFSNHKQIGWKCFNGDLNNISLIGIYESRISGMNTIKSISGYEPTGDKSWNDFKGNTGDYSYDDDRIHLVTVQQHSIMQLLAYAYYGNTDLQSICGKGTNSNDKITGNTDDLGMKDTDTITGNGADEHHISINFWGIENWWGNKYEFVDNIQVAEGSDNDDIILNILKPGTNIVERQIHTKYCDGVITKINITEDGIIIPAEVTEDYEDVNFAFADCGYVFSGAGYVAERSSSCDSSNGGVGFLYVADGPDYSYSIFGSRIAYTGPVVIVDKFNFQD